MKKVKEKPVRGVLFWVIFYTLILAVSQVFLKYGVSKIGSFKISELKDIIAISLQVIKNPIIIISTVLMASSFFLWLFILSWYKLSVVFPLTALVYVFVAIISFFVLKEHLVFYNYLGILLITIGVILLAK